MAEKHLEIQPTFVYFWCYLSSSTSKYLQILKTFKSFPRIAKENVILFWETPLAKWARISQAGTAYPAAGAMAGRLGQMGRLWLGSNQGGTWALINGSPAGDPARSRAGRGFLMAGSMCRSMTYLALSVVRTMRMLDLKKAFKKEKRKEYIYICDGPNKYTSFAIDRLIPIDVMSTPTLIFSSASFSFTSTTFMSSLTTSTNFLFVSSNML